MRKPVRKPIAERDYLWGVSRMVDPAGITMLASQGNRPPHQGIYYRPTKGRFPRTRPKQTHDQSEKTVSHKGLHQRKPLIDWASVNNCTALAHLKQRLWVKRTLNDFEIKQCRITDAPLSDFDALVGWNTTGCCSNRIDHSSMYTGQNNEHHPNLS